MSELDYGTLIRQKQAEIIELVHAYNKSKENSGNEKGKTGFASSSTGKAKSLKIIDFRRLLLG